MRYAKERPATYLMTALLATLLSLGGMAAAQAAEFSYNGDTGPAYWWELDGEWAACAGDSVDAAQSPINISKTKFDKSLKKLELVTYPTTIDIFNNGHTIEQRYEDTGSTIYFNGVSYELAQFHFHTLSEHVVDSRHALMEMHLVFSEPGGTNLVIGQLFGPARGNNQFIQKLIDAGLPQKDGDETITTDLIDVGDGLVNTNSYYTYSGSLTTPPCSEVVTWVVLKKHGVLSKEQFQAFRKILGNNFRPVQDQNGREVTATWDHK